MATSVIKVENLSKIYSLGEVGTGTITRDFQRWLARIRGKEDPSGRIDMESDTRKGIHKALEDLTFEVRQGEVLGIIGKNGAGKSTLLKILSRITTPTTGSFKVKGRIASLLEVGTGFHPDLTGRENIFLNAAILGMSKAEVKNKFDEIVDFSGVEKFIDTPVKRYSSGMYVRLAFAVAAHLESEILIIDEVLAVGDAEFQKKCMGKMKDVSAHGRTVLFVSHNMAAIKNLCTRGVLLNGGKIVYDGDVPGAVDKYLTQETDMSKTGVIPLDLPRMYSNGKAKFTRVELTGESSGKITNQLYYREKFRVKVEFDVLKDTIDDAVIIIMVGTIDGSQILYTDSFERTGSLLQFNAGSHAVEVSIYDVLQPGTYSVYMGICHRDGYTIDWVERALDFTVSKISHEKNNDYLWRVVFGHVNTGASWTVNAGKIADGLRK
jgi:lipopolysaccharide transport system ATP-binding protein